MSNHTRWPLAPNCRSTRASSAVVSAGGIFWSAAIVFRATDKGVHMLKEFQEFIAKGNVMDLAVGVIIGAAFGAIVTSLTGDVIMPIVGAIFGGLDFSNYFIPLGAEVTAGSLEAAREQGAVLAYGAFLTAVINFLILAFIIFLMVKAVNNMKRKQETEAEAAPAAPAEDVVLLTEIRDLLRKQA